MTQVVVLETKMPSGRMKKCRLQDMLHTSYSLLGVSKSSDTRKKIIFCGAYLQISDKNKILISVATRICDLYYIELLSCSPKVLLTYEQKL